jgi:restriction endonuclease S subunit
MISHKSVQAILLDIHSGFSFRNKIEHIPEGNISVIQVKDLEKNYTSIGTGLTRICARNMHSKFFLRTGDVLFLAKGANNFAISYAPILENVIPTSAFFILRPDSQQVLPGYLAWYINQPPVQRYLKTNAVGTYISNVNKGTIEKIILQVPEIDVQKKIITIDQFQKRENSLLHEMMVRRNELISAKLIALIQT